MKNVAGAKSVAIAEDAELDVTVATDARVEDMDGEDDQPA
jgi:hypothetical protein